MSQVGSGERVLILSDRVSTSVTIGADQDTPESGRILLFLDSTPSQGLWSKDEFGVVKALNGSLLTDASWLAFLPSVTPTPAGDITHPGRAAVGEATSGGIPSGIQFFVVGDFLLEGSAYLEQDAVRPDQTGATQVFAKSLDNGLFSKPAGLPERRIDAPGLVRRTLPANETVIVPDGSQYLVYGSFTLEAGAALILEGDADLVVL